MVVEDGTYRIEQSTPVEQGEFTLEGNVLTFITGEASRNCEVGDRLVSVIDVLEDSPLGQDRIRQTQVTDECRIRGSVKVVTLQRVA